MSGPVPVRDNARRTRPISEGGWLLELVHDICEARRGLEGLLLDIREAADEAAIALDEEHVDD